MTIAPSFAGLTEASRLSINYRDQWPALKPAVFRTYSVGVDHWFDRAKSGVGLLIFRDVAGEGNLGLTEASLLYSYKIKIGQKRGSINNEWFLRPGIQFKYSQRSIDWDKLTFGDQLLGAESTSEANIFANKSYIDFNASLLGYTDLYWAGFSVDHLLKPNQSLRGLDYRMNMKLSVFGGAKIMLKEQRNKRVRYDRDAESVTFAINYQYWDKFDQLDIGAYWTHDPLILGAWFRGIPIIDKQSKTFNNIDAIIILVGLKVSPNMKIGYSYDMTVINSLFSHTGGAHEISLVYEFNKTGSRYKHTIIPCPSF